MKKLVLAALAAALTCWFTANPAAAGGWALPSLDSTPVPVAGVPLEVGFTILQHGVTPAKVDGDVGIEVTTADGTSRFFAATPSGTPVHYTAVVSLDHAGTTRWSVHLGWFGAQDLGDITVAATDASADTVAAARPSETAPTSPSPYRWPGSVRYATLVGAFVLACASAATVHRPRRYRPVGA